MKVLHSTRRAAESGFSLIEVLIAITIIALMGSAVAFGVFDAFFQSQRDRAAIDIDQLAQAVKLYRAKEGKLPSESEWPEFLTEGSKRYKRPYLDNVPEDPWGNTYEYKKIGSKFDIVSMGADGVMGGDGDDADIHYLDEDKR